MLVQELFSLGEAVKISLILTIPSNATVSFKGLSDTDKAKKIFNEFVENQDILTIENVKIEGDKVKIMPHFTEIIAGGAVNELQKKLQTAFDEWISNLAD